MKIKLITIDILDTDRHERELNAFLASHAIHAVSRQLVQLSELEQRRQELPIGVPQRERARQPQRQPGLPRLLGLQPERRPRSGQNVSRTARFPVRGPCRGKSRWDAVAGSLPEGAVEGCGIPVSIHTEGTDL